MGTIEHFAKWDKINKQWRNPTFEDFGNCFSIADYKTIINEPNTGINYIIIASGSRLERNTKEYLKIDEKIYRIDNVIDHYKHQKGNYHIQCFFIDKDAPIIETAKKFAEYIDSLSTLPSTKTINVMGVSKCGAMSLYTPRFFKHNESFQKFNLFNVTVPYQGTKFASPKLVLSEARAFSKKLFGNSSLGKLVFQKLKETYQDGCSYSHMDYDISLENSIGGTHRALYDKNFIKNMFCNENIAAIREINSFKNFTTRIDKFTLPEAIRTLNTWGISLCIINDIFFERKADGLVPYESQKSIDDILHVESIHLPSSHHDVNTNIRVCNQILEEIDKTIEPTLRLK